MLLVKTTSYPLHSNAQNDDILLIPKCSLTMPTKQTFDIKKTQANHLSQPLQLISLAKLRFVKGDICE